MEYKERPSEPGLFRLEMAQVDLVLLLSSVTQWRGTQQKSVR